MTFCKKTLHRSYIGCSGEKERNDLVRLVICLYDIIEGKILYKGTGEGIIDDGVKTRRKPSS